MQTKEEKAAYQLERYRARRAYAVEKLGGKCVVCKADNADKVMNYSNTIDTTQSLAIVCSQQCATLLAKSVNMILTQFLKK